MLDLALKLIDRCIDLVKRREETSRQLYEKFVTPTVADFEAVHNDYMDKFLIFRSLLEKLDYSGDWINTALEHLSRDSMFSENLRSKLWANWTADDDHAWTNTTEQTRAFIAAISRYLTLPSFPGFSRDMSVRSEPSDTSRWFYFGASNEIRYNLSHTLIYICDGRLRSFTWEGPYYNNKYTSPDRQQALALEAVDLLVCQLQDSYADAMRAHENLKIQLLLPK